MPSAILSCVIFIKVHHGLRLGKQDIAVDS
jgi:hypothetical protein